MMAFELDYNIYKEWLGWLLSHTQPPTFSKVYEWNQLPLLTLLGAI